jgi:hypothetical protein
MTKYSDLAKSKKAATGTLKQCKPCAARLKREYIRRDWFSYKARSLKQEASKKRVPFDLDRAFLRDLWDKQGGVCALTGVKMEIFIGAGNYKKASMDQIVPAAGYTRDNVHFVTDWANRAKVELSIESFGDFVLEASKHITKLREEQKTN